MRSGSRSSSGDVPEAPDLRHEVVHRRHRVGADGVDAGAPRLERQGHRERRAQGIGLGVPMADGHDPSRSEEACGHRVGHGREVGRRHRAQAPQRSRRCARSSRERGASSATTSTPRPAERIAVDVAAVAARRAARRSRPARAGSLRVCGLASVGLDGRLGRRWAPPRARASICSRSCMTRVPRSALSSSRRCSSGMRFRRSDAEMMAHEGHGAAEHLEGGPPLRSGCR